MYQKSTCLYPFKSKMEDLFYVDDVKSILLIHHIYYFTKTEKLSNLTLTGNSEFGINGDSVF